MKKLLVYAIASFLITSAAVQTPQKKGVSSTKMTMNMKADGGMAVDTLPSMNSQLSLGLPMNRDGSGTSWVPDDSPLYAYMFQGKKWTSMIHGSLFARFTGQDVFNTGTRGGHQFDAPDWVMAMTQHRSGTGGLFSISAMFSLDAFLVSPRGYPLLYQTGESYRSVPLVDEQHPHDLFSELSLAYSQRVGQHSDIEFSFGYPGEPALGPPVFMHRLSAMDDPDAPLSHHYADATHITFGTATLGWRYRNIKLEGSVFTGREPDQYRYNFDPMRFDSYSVRLSYNPSNEWALQVSNGWLHSPEATSPHQNADRFTISAIYTRMLNDDSFIASTLVYGQNHFSDNQQTLPSILWEASLHWHAAAFYGRYEYVKKNAEELNLIDLYPPIQPFTIHAVTLGFNQTIATLKQTNLTAGVQSTVNISPTALKTLYGSMPVGFELYLRITPALIKMKSGHQMNGMLM